MLFLPRNMKYDLDIFQWNIIEINGYSDSRKLWAVMKGGGLALSNLIQPTISLEMPVPCQGHYGFHSFPIVDWFCLFIYLWVLTFPNTGTKQLSKQHQIW
jgi:hypothetical protein